MTDNGLPKSTMSNFIKQSLSEKRKVSAQFTTLLLDLSKQFIDKVSAHANKICEQEGKKTINNDHLYSAHQNLGMGDITQSLKKIDSSLKMKQMKRQQDKVRVEECIDRLKKQRVSEHEQHNNQKIPIIENRSVYKPIEFCNDQLNFAKILQEQVENQSQLIKKQKV